MPWLCGNFNHFSLSSFSSPAMAGWEMIQNWVWLSHPSDQVCFTFACRHSSFPDAQCMAYLSTRLGSLGGTAVHLSQEKNPGWLGYIGDYTTQLYRDYNKPL